VQAPTTIGAVENDAKAQASEKLKEMIQQAEGATAGGTAE